MVYLCYMNRGRHSAGYTIVETLIFLAVSGALFVSTMGLISGKQGKTEFTQAARDFEIQMQDIANDVSTGYYTNTVTSDGSFIECTLSGNEIRITTPNSTDRQGANRDCIFVGRSLQVGIDPNPGQYNIYSLVGKRLASNGADSSTIAESSLVVIPQSTESKIVNYYEFSCMFYATGPVTPSADKPCSNTPSSPTATIVKTDTLSFTTTFVGLDAAQERKSGDTQVNLVVANPSSTPIGRDVTDAIGEIESYDTGSPQTNPAGGVYICIQSNSSRQFALLRMGGNGSRFSTDMKIQTGDCI